MSLVSDALKKAQRDAAAREARDKGLPPPLAMPTQPFRARRRRAAAPWAAIASATLLVATAAGLFFWTKSGERVALPQAQREEAPEKGKPAVAAPAASPRPAVTPAPFGAAAAPATPSMEAFQPVPAPATAPRTATAATPAPPSMEAFPTPSPAATVSASPPAAAARAVAPPPAARGPEPATFVREATLADGTRLRLGGIAYSDAAPLAYLNGKLVGVGERVESCRVERIERGGVALDCPGAPVVLTLK